MHWFQIITSNQKLKNSKKSIRLAKKGNKEIFSLTRLLNLSWETCSDVGLQIFNRLLGWALVWRSLWFYFLCTWNLAWLTRLELGFCFGLCLLRRFCNRGRTLNGFTIFTTTWSLVLFIWIGWNYWVFIVIYCFLAFMNFFVINCLAL